MLYNVCRKAKENYVKLRKERDYHRMHHKRVVQEKNKLINDLKRWMEKKTKSCQILNLLFDSNKYVKSANVQNKYPCFPVVFIYNFVADNLPVIFKYLQVTKPLCLVWTDTSPAETEVWDSYEGKDVNQVTERPRSWTGAGTTEYH